jgi:hypothetical protein
MADSSQPQAPKQKVLVITRTTFLDIDKIVSAIVLGKLLSKRANTDVDLFFGEKLPLNSLTTLVSPQDVNFREKLVPDYFTLSINRGNAKVKEVKWEEVGSELKLIIYTDQGEIIDSEHKVGGATPAYDAVYTLGIKTKEEAQNALGEFANLWQSSNTFNLDIRAENQRYAANNHVYADAKAFAECVFKFAQEQEIEVSSMEATELLSCIYWKTNSLRNKYTTFDTLGTVQQLIQKGGSVADAVSRVFSTLSFVEVRARQDIYKTLKLTAEKIAFAQVSPETARQLTKIEPINPEKNPLFKLKDAITSFVLVPIAPEQTLVLCSSRDEKVNIKRLFSNYNYVGDSLQAELMFNLNLADTEKELKKGLLKVFPRPAASEKHQPLIAAPVEPAPVPTVTPAEIPVPDVIAAPLPIEEVTPAEAEALANEVFEVDSPIDIPADIFADESEPIEENEMQIVEEAPLAPAHESDFKQIVTPSPEENSTSNDPLPSAS